MPTNETETFLKLVEQNETIATELPTTLAELAAEDTISADEVIDLTSATLTRLVERGGDPQRITERLPDLLAKYPELQFHTIEPLSRMALHENTKIRLAGIRCLGFLGSHESIESEFVAERVADAFTTDHRVIRQAALWSLTKLGLADPDLITPRRHHLVDLLGARPSLYREGSESGVLRRYATEALAVNALGDIDIDACAPRGDPFSNMESTAAWAVQWTVAQQGISINCDDQIARTTTIDEDHSIAREVAEILAEYIKSGDDTAVATGAVFALGCLAPWQEDMQEYIALLNEVDNADTEYSNSLADAARHVLEQGPFTPDNKSLFNPSTDAEIQLEVAPLDRYGGACQDYPSEIAVPHGAADASLDSDIFRLSSGTVEISGIGSGETQSARLAKFHQQDGRLLMQDRLRQKLGIDFGDIVTVRPTSTIPARKAELALPAEIPIATKDLISPSARSEFGLQRYTVGDTLSISVITSPELLMTELSKVGDWSCLPNEAKEQSTHHIPLRVASSIPATANRITSNTELIIRRKNNMDIEICKEIAPIGVPEPFRPTAAVRTQIEEKSPESILTGLDDETINEIFRGSWTSNNLESHEVTQKQIPETTEEISEDKWTEICERDCCNNIEKPEGAPPEEGTSFPSEDELNKKSVEIEPEDIPENATAEDVKQIIEERLSSDE